MSRPSIYTQKSGPFVNMNMPIGASEVFKNLSGKFVEPDGSGRIELCDDGDDTMIGWAFQTERTASSTEGRDTADVNVSYDAVYEIPAYTDGTAITEATLIAAVGETCDLKVDSNIQYADIGASTDDCLLIVGYRYYGSSVGQQSVLVQRVPLNITYTGVA